MPKSEPQLTITVPLSLFSKLSLWLGSLALAMEAVEKICYTGEDQTFRLTDKILEIKQEVDAVVKEHQLTH